MDYILRPDGQANLGESPLIFEAKEFLAQKGPYILPSLRGLIRHELALAEKGVPNDLKHYLFVGREKFNKAKLEIAERQARREEEIQWWLRGTSREQVLLEIAQCEQKSREFQAKLRKIRVDERTQRKARLQNAIEGNAKRLMLLQDMLAYLDKKKSHLDSSPELISTSQALELVKQEFRKVTAPSKIRRGYAPQKFHFQESRPIEDFPAVERKIIYLQLVEEAGEKYIEDYTYLFTSLSPDDLPISAWEQPWERYAGINPQSLLPILGEIREVQDLIEKEGFKAKYPLLLTAYSRGDFAVDGGHHRLQAVRNLIAAGKLPVDFKVPCVVRFSKRDFEYRKVNFRELLDYSVKLSDFLANPEDGEYDFRFSFPRDFAYAYLEKHGLNLRVKIEAFTLHENERKIIFETIRDFLTMKLGPEYEYTFIDVFAESKE